MSKLGGVEKPTWHGFAVYAGRVRLGTLERVWRGSSDGGAVIAVRSSFPGVPDLLVRLADIAEICTSGRRIEVGDKPHIVLDARRRRGDQSLRPQSEEGRDEFAGGGGP